MHLYFLFINQLFGLDAMPCCDKLRHNLNLMYYEKSDVSGAYNSRGPVKRMQ
jgi:hypothetical protein